MAIEDTFGYRFVRISLVLLNCLVLVRLVSLLLQYSHVFEPTFVIFIILIGSNFIAAIIGAIREHRIAVLVTGSLTLIMFLSLLFTNKENKNINASLFTLLAIAAQSLIFSEMLKERQLFLQRQNMQIFGNMNTNHRNNHAPLAAVVVYQPPGTNQGQSGGIFMVDPIMGTEIPKDPPPSYFANNYPPKYEDALKLSAATIMPNGTEVVNQQDVDQAPSSSTLQSTATNFSNDAKSGSATVEDGNKQDKNNLN